MTFDDGIMRVYEITNIAEPGNKPVEGLVFREAFFFGYTDLGINRYYTAKMAHEQIEAVVYIPGWHPIKANEYVAVMEDDAQFVIRMVQPTTDDDGLRVTRLSLERIGDKYAI